MGDSRLAGATVSTRLIGLVAVTGLAAASLWLTPFAPFLTNHEVGSRPALDVALAGALAVACALFLTAGVLRLARWQLTRDVHGALVGCALVLMGGLYLPLGGVAHLAGTDVPTTLLASDVRTAVCLLCAGLGVRALYTTTLTVHETPGRLLSVTSGASISLFGLLICVHASAPGLFETHPPVVLLLAVIRCTAWLGVATLAARRVQVVPWARRAAPLCLGVGLAEALRAVDAGRAGTWTLAGLVLCSLLAAHAATAALVDLNRTVRDTQRRLRGLHASLDQFSSEADDLGLWREQLAHDARNACAGLRAALTTLERYDGRVDPGTADRLRQAATNEVGHLEHLLTRSSATPCGSFDVVPVVEQVVESARILGARVQVVIPDAPAWGLGRPGDLAAVLKQVLCNAETHAPGSDVHVAVGADAGVVTITCADNGPGLPPRLETRVFDHGVRGETSPGSGLGLYAARQLMLEQQGDLVVSGGGAGACFVLTLPASVAVSRR